MATIDRGIDKAPIESGPLWPAVARQLRGWADTRGLQVRDTVLLLPFAALLAPARAAFAAGAGWLPRIETTRTLAASLTPPPIAAPGAISGDAVLDALTAAVLLRRQPWGAAQARGDRRAFAHTVGLVVDAAQALRDASLLLPPAQRPPFWGRVRDALPAPAGPGAFEALLLRVALEWAAQGGAAPADALFGHRPAGWAVLRLGGSDGLAEAVAAAAAASGPTPALLLDADAAPRAVAAAPQRWVCDSAEQEAWAAATQVIQALNDGRAPVALVALDRVQVRRVRALLARQQVALIDETGWKLSTTRAAARLMALLRAAVPSASADARLDWLKGWPPAAPLPRALNTLEALWRGVPRPGDTEAADALWAQAQAHLQRLADARERPLSDWLERLAAMLADDGSLASMQSDAAGVQVLQALRLTKPGAAFAAAAAAWRAAADASPMDLSAFTAWVDATLEAAQFLPPPDAGAQVVLTPLARAIGRPFGAVVAPGADQQHLGGSEPAPALIGEALAAQLGLDGAARRHLRQRLAFTQLLRVPSVSLLRRRLEGDEPLAASPEVEALALACAVAGTPLPPERAWRALQAHVVATPLQRPAPAAADDLPQSLSASTVSALRQCPYRFFGRAVLRLSDRDELDAEVAKRDYGSWVHAVLHRFHSQRAQVDGDGDGDGAGPAAQDGGGDSDAEADAGAGALAAAADAVTVEHGLDAGELLPFRASFDVFAPAYLAWLAERTAQGWRWQQGETERISAPAALHPQLLRGRLDRLDAAPGGGLQLIDYKTGRVDKLKQQAADPLEDTQLAFYAALEPATRSAIYLALDDAKAPLAVEHKDVAATAAVMVDALAGEFARLRGGAGLPALGEGSACSYCEARGLCRRDHWSAA